MSVGTKKLVVIFAVLLLVLGAATFYFYRKSRAVQNSSSALAGQNEAKKLAEKVAKLIVLPAGEIPTIATVSDPAALKDQVFFTGAKKGDKVLIYTNAKKAILYDPASNKIVNVAPINIGEEKPVPDIAPATPGDSAARKGEF